MSLSNQYGLMNRLTDESCFNPTVQTFLFSFAFHKWGFIPVSQNGRSEDQITAMSYTCSSLISSENLLHKADQYSKDGSHEHEPN